MPLPNKVEAIKNIAVPTTKKQLISSIVPNAKIGSSLQQ